MVWSPVYSSRENNHENISGDMLTHEVIKTSKTFYRSQDLQVEIGGSTAATDGKKVMLPSIPTDVDYTADEVAVVRGFVDHEAGHGRHTNFKIARRKQWREAILKYAHLMPIANGLEDVRIERHITVEYPGSRSAISRQRLHGPTTCISSTMPRTRLSVVTSPRSVLSLSRGKVVVAWAMTTRLSKVSRHIDP